MPNKLRFRRVPTRIDAPAQSSQGTQPVQAPINSMAAGMDWQPNRETYGDQTAESLAEILQDRDQMIGKPKSLEPSAYELQEQGMIVQTWQTGNVTNAEVSDTFNHLHKVILFKAAADTPIIRSER